MRLLKQFVMEEKLILWNVDGDVVNGKVHGLNEI